MVPPHELAGYAIMWRVATESTSKLVTDAAAKLLVRMHHEVVGTLIEQIPAIEDKYIEMCFSIIEASRAGFENRTEEEATAFATAWGALPTHASAIMSLKVLPVQERKVLRAIFLLRQLIRASEKNGTHNLKPHASLAKSAYLGRL